MPIQITILGLGRVGMSIGLALGKIKDQATRIGNDRDPGTMRKAERLGAVDKTMINLPSSVRDADVVILALPTNEVRETMEVIVQDLKPGSVLIDTSLSKGKVMEWAQELLPGDDRYFVGFTPSLNPAYLEEIGAAAEEPHADLFQNSLIMINTPPGIDESAITLATNLVQILGATPLYSDAIESDGLIACSQILPGLASTALTNAIIDQPGWRESRKIAGTVFVQATEPVAHYGDGKGLRQAALNNPENTVRVIDNLIAELRSMRDAITRQDADDLDQAFADAEKRRTEWFAQRYSAEWERGEKNVHMPTSGEVFGRLLGIKPRKEKGKDQ
jgi:prephenate dehydrogenase